MSQAIGAYRQVTATDEFKEIERMRSDARHNEASALRNARNKRSIEIARKALEMSMTIDDITQLTGLTREQVEGLREAE